VLISTTPLLAAIVMPLVNRRRPHGLVLLGSLVGFVGVVLLVGGAGSDGSSLRGDLIALASAVIWIGVVVWPLPLMARYGVEKTNAWLFAMSLITILPMTSPTIVDVARNPPGWIAWAAVIYGGLIGILLGNILWFRAIEKSGVESVLVYQYLPPVLTLLIAVIFLGEHVTWGQAIGSVLVLAGVVVVQRATQRRPAVPSELA
jgi:drug/metabolite transporter (DMT)-like permease